MDKKRFCILAIAGSLRQGSYNRGLLRAAEELAPDWVEVQFFDIDTLPFFVADAWDAVFPSDVIPPAGRIPEQDPFMTPSFTQYAMSLPLVDRYAASLSTPYHRSKSLVIQLYPHHVHAVLPSTKQIFSRSFETYQQHSLNVERCIAYGLICKKHLDTCRDASLLRTVQAIEQWMIGAEQRGATVTE